MSDSSSLSSETRSLVIRKRLRDDEDDVAERDKDYVDPKRLFVASSLSPSPIQNAVSSLSPLPIQNAVEPEIAPLSTNMPMFSGAADNEYIFVEKNRDFHQYEFDIRRLLIVNPKSSYLHGALLLSLIKRVVSRRIRSSRARLDCLKNGLETMQWSVLFLNGEDKSRIDWQLGDCDVSLKSLFDNILQKTNTLGKTCDEIVALVVEQSEQESASLETFLLNKKAKIVEKARAVTALDDLAPDEIENLNEEHVCVVCLAQPRQICQVPCGHICMCSNCSVSCNTCPVCRKDIVQKVRFIIP